jgi:protein O-GlcNAc transferase
LSPAKLQSILQTGIAHLRAGRLAEAELALRQARTAAPKNFDVLHLSGLVAHQQGKSGEAVDLLSRALALRPEAVMCEHRLAVALGAAHRHVDAEKHLRHAVALKPDFHEGWDQLANCLKQQDRLGEALHCHEKAVTLKPDFAAGWVNFGFTLRLAGKHAEALVCHERALAAAPDYAPGRFGRAQSLQQLHRVREAIAEYGAFLKLRPQAHEARSNRLFALQNLDDVSREQIFAEHVAYGRALGRAPAPHFPQAPDAGRRLRVAVLSPDLRAHSCAYFLEPLLRHLDREQFELHLYHDHFREDTVTARLRSLATGWRNFSGQSAATVEQAIRGDQPDILVDLAGHTGITNRLPVLARRVAPVQITYLGYPNTTGVPAIDYRFTDAIADPVGEADPFATEKLVRFAPTAWTYLPPADAPEVAPLPALARGHVTFGSFNDLAKITDAMLATWSRILAGVEGSRLKLKGRGLSEPAVRAELEHRIVRAGIELARVELLERTPDTVSHLALYHDIDIALDTFPYNGTTTTCEALWMGVPVVSLVGDRHMSRVGASLLTAIGHPEWCANDRDSYVRCVTELAGDLVLLARIRASLRTDLRRSALLDYAGQAACFGAALRDCWAKWCERVTPAEIAAV